MSKFNVGDKVKRTKDLDNFPLGSDTCTVSKVRPATGSIELEEIPNGFAYDDRCFELVINTKFKVGDLITRKDNNIHYSDKEIVNITPYHYVIRFPGSPDNYSYTIKYTEETYELKEPLPPKADLNSLIDLIMPVEGDTFKLDVTTPDCLKKASETQVGGDHYTKMKLQPLEACYQRYGYIGLKASIHTKVDKYFRSKENEIEDLKKAVHCIQILIEKAELEAKNNANN